VASHTIFSGELGIDERSWTNKDGTYKTRFRAYIWQSILKKKTYFTLKATNLVDAKKEAVKVYSQYQKDLEAGNDISVRRKKLRHFLDLFLKSKEFEVQRGNLSNHRYVCLIHTMKQLDRFSKNHKEPDLDRLAKVYGQEFEGYNFWRSQQRAQKTGKPLSNRTLNNEMNDHKSFFNWCIQQGYSSVRAMTKDNKLTKSNYPFPSSHYPKLIKVAQTDINTAVGPKRKWSKVNYLYAILLMNGIGCRVVEIKNLQWEHLSYDKAGNASLKLHGKSKERTIQIPLRVAEHLERLRAFKKHHGKIFKWNEDDHSFIFSAYRKNEPPVHFNGECRRRWMKESGVQNYEDFQYVCFRHKFITDALRNGVHSLQVAKYTGTSQLMIEKTYEGLIPKDVFDLVFKEVPDSALAAKQTMPKFLGIREDDIDVVVT
jgi:site-specific recombinase XerD